MDGNCYVLSEMLQLQLHTTEVLSTYSTGEAGIQLRVDSEYDVH